MRTGPENPEVVYCVLSMYLTIVTWLILPVAYACLKD